MGRDALRVLVLVSVFCTGGLFGMWVAQNDEILHGEWVCTASHIEPNMGTKQRQPMAVCDRLERKRN